MTPTLAERLDRLIGEMQSTAEIAEIQGEEEVFRILDSAAYRLREELTK